MWPVIGGATAIQDAANRLGVTLCCDQRRDRPVPRESGGEPAEGDRDPRVAFTSNGRLPWPHIAVELMAYRQLVRRKTRWVLLQQIALRAPQASA
jgi:hypothetical protein